MITFVSPSSLNNNAAATSVGVARTVPAGNLMIVSMMTNDLANAGTISDTNNNTWNICTPDLNDATNIVRMRSWYAFSNKSTSTTVTVTTGGGVGGFITIFIDEFVNAGVIDKSASSPLAQSGTTVISGAIVPSLDSELVWAVASDNVTAVGNIDGSPATKGADDLHGDWTEWRVLSGRSGVSMTADFVGAGGSYDVQVASFGPRVKRAVVPLRPRSFAPGHAR